MKKIFKVVFLISGVLIVLAAGCKKDQGIGQDPYEQLAKDTLMIRSYLADSIPAIQHPTGIYYQIKNPGNGSMKYSAATVVEAKYTGKILGGNKFDAGTHKFRLGEVITGWQIGIQLIQKGGKIRLIIPSGYAYGPNSSEKIPSNSILDFEIELIDVIN